MQLWEQDSGSWMGGELGHARDVLHTYNNFFIENQATAIIQHLYPLYMLTINSTDGIPTLNPHAQQAVDQLPSVYDVETYRHFMDSWGTHIAVKTELGGMREQQILFKDCIWQSLYFTGGLTDSELELRLKQDLISPASMNDSYHEERRKITLDHRIGGDVNVSDFDQWKKTLGSSPALLKISKYISWSDVVQNSTIKTNLQTAITDRVKSAAAARIAGIDQVKRQKLAALFSQRLAQAVVGHGSRGPVPPSWELGNVITLKDVQQCPEGLSLTQSKEKCNTGTYITSWNTVEVTEPLRYERNAATGMFRSIRVRDIVAGQNIERFGPWVKSGCSLLPTSWSNMNEPPPVSTVVAMICADCIPTTSGADQERFSCECPSY
ncbi:unnamed protein product [Didymodactylos carnosus]|uniref:MACPF domain-containing protein n=1 Tax=Didymodactylos carnosus TaxID=1234261 RepID=A0A8S2Q395_9BILA|nr:unnamed protein product [Didymodactylos carnosus]CAF4082072.1 unnamed protein product [Didymodactylos carnosus]